MNSEISNLYQEVILDHNKNPRNFGGLDPHTHSAKGHNPLCGDKLEIQLFIENNVIVDVKFQGQGCAISKASASIMTSLIKGKTIDAARELFSKFHHLVTNEHDNEEIDIIDLGKLAVFAGVKDYPARVKCASLAWHTLNNAIAEKSEIAITE